VRSVRRFGGGRAGVDLRERAAGGLRRRRWNLQKHFHVGDQQVVNLGRHLCLVGGDLLDDLPQRGEVYGYLLHLLGVEERGGPFRRDPIHSQPSRRPTLNTLLRGDPYRRRRKRNRSLQSLILAFGNNRRRGFTLAHVLRAAGDAQKSQHRGH
jgi:hypothetical protein